MSFTVVYLHPCRRDRLRAAFIDSLAILGTNTIYILTRDLQKNYRADHSHRMNYLIAIATLHVTVGVVGLTAAAIVKEAWNPGSLREETTRGLAQHPTHLATHTTQ